MKDRATTWIVIAMAAAIAWLGAADRPGGWNDGSRLATVECLVDYGTWAIDDSIFCTPGPYGEGVAPAGTLDKLFIQGRFYSDKSPVPAFLMAGPYWIWRQCGGPSVAERPDLFCQFLTFLSAGLAYVLAVAGIDVLARRSFSQRMRIALTASFALATIALPYSRSVNNHILLLAIATWLLVGFELLSSFPSSAWERTVREALLRGQFKDSDGAYCEMRNTRSRASRAVRSQAELGNEKKAVRFQAELGNENKIEEPSWPLPVGLGTLTGLSYTIDLGVGPVLALGAGLLAAWRLRVSKKLAAFVIVALSWLALHHGLNYYIGGTIRPANANPEFFHWVGCPFDSTNLTGAWNHQNLLDFALYAADMLVGKRGFLGHNLALYLAIPATVVLLRRPHPRRPELLLCAGWCIGTWLVYAATSKNMSGACCSVRWFVPLLAPSYYVLVRLLGDRPEFAGDFLALSTIGAAIGTMSWFRGPWISQIVPGYWGLIAAAGIAWGCAARRRMRNSPPPELVLQRAA